MPPVCWGGGRSVVRMEKPLSEAVNPAPYQSHTEDLGGSLFLRNSFLERALWGEWETARTSQNFIQIVVPVCPNRAMKRLLAREDGCSCQAGGSAFSQHLVKASGMITGQSEASRAALKPLNHSHRAAHSHHELRCLWEPTRLLFQKAWAQMLST